LLDVTISHKPYPARVSAKRKRKGLRGATAKTRRTIADCVKVMMDVSPKGSLAFWTVTIPPMSEADHARVCQSWSSIVGAVKTAIERLLASKSLPVRVLFVTEVQPGRYKNSGVVGLHLHVLFATRKGLGCPWLVSIPELDAIWAKVLSHKLNRQVDIGSACKLVAVKGSPQKELSKYLSKSDKIITQIHADGKENLLPKNYFYCSESIRTIAKQKVKTFTGKAVEVFYDNTELLEKYGYIKARTITRKFPDLKNLGEYQSIIVGKAGYIKDEFIEIFDWLLLEESRISMFIESLRLKELTAG